MTYNYEWPNTSADFRKLFSLKSFELQEIYTCIKKVDGKSIIGIKFIFYGETNPITFGKLDGTAYARALFKSSEQISSIKLTGEKTDEGSKCREIEFFGKDGKRTEGWKVIGIDIASAVRIYSDLFPSTFAGKEAKIPDGHQIVGFAVKTDAKGNIIWLDLKTWKPPKRA
jgi:hypothetical protein